MRLNKPRITKRTNQGGTKSYCVDGGIVNGKRHRRFFATKAEAETYAEQLLIAKKNQGASAFSLTDKQRVEAADAFKRLEPFGVSLREGIEFFIKHARPKGGTRLAGEVAVELLDSKSKSGKKPRYLKALRIAFGIFNRVFGDKPIHEIQRAAIEDWLDSRPLALTTRRNYIRDISILFAFAVERGYAAENALAQIERPTLTDKPPGILTVGEAVAVLDAVQNTPQFQLAPYLTIGLFAGLRASELAALDWQEINLAERTIEVTATKSKTRKRRIVEVSDNLAAWLTPHVQASGCIVPSGWRDRLQRLVKLAGITWPSNALRHSFASYHLAKHKNAALTALQLGHADTNMLFAHYRELVKLADADRFWQLHPPTPANLLTLPAPVAGEPSAQANA